MYLLNKLIIIWTSALLSPYFVDSYIARAAHTGLRRGNGPQLRAAAAEITDDAEARGSDVETKKYIKTATLNSIFNITATNPYGERVSGAMGAKEELLSLLQTMPIDSPRIADEDASKHFRIDYLVKVLEAHHTPIQTSQFLTLVITGRWKLCYSNIVRHKADESLKFTIYQNVSSTDMISGSLCNSVEWRLERPDDEASGVLNIVSSYSILPEGSLGASLMEHVLLPKSLPRDVEELISSIQRSVPYDFFDNDETVSADIYVDPTLRIVRVSGDMYYNVINVFIRADNF